MKSFILYWRDGKKEIIVGDDIADALRRAGYLPAALAALDFYGNDDEYAWESGNWVRKSEER